MLNGSWLQSVTSAFLPGSSVPTRSAMPSAFAGLAVNQRTASALLIWMSARHAAESAAAASWFNRWMTIGSSEWMIAQPPAAWTSAAFSSIASNTSILYPHQLAQVATRSEEHTSALQSLMRNSYAVL